MFVNKGHRALFFLLGLWPVVGQTTTYFQADFEDKPCGYKVRNENYGGARWDTFYDNVGTVSCSVPAPTGGKARYYEWTTDSQTPAMPGLYFPSEITVVSGTTYYLAAFWRFERINNNTVWHNQWDFDKLLEFGSNSSGFRWIMQDGYNADYPYSADNFQFSIYASETVFPSGTFTPNWNYFEQNYGGFSLNTPLKSSYERWHTVVMGITAHQTNGAIRLWVNGTQVLQRTGIKTMQSGATIPHIAINGTVGQPQYDAPTHKRQVDNLLMTDSWLDIQNGGYLVNPEVRALAPPSTPSSLMIR